MRCKRCDAKKEVSELRPYRHGNVRGSSAVNVKHMGQIIPMTPMKRYLMLCKDCMIAAIEHKKEQP